LKSIFDALTSQVL